MPAARHRVAVVTDSTAALPAGAAERWGVTVVPLDVVVDGQRFTEGVSLPPAALVERLRDGRSFTTRRIVARQRGEAIFTMVASFHEREA
ncbi:MAG: DegV family protein, partial [Cellulomonas sp.]|nr:DegV family protein [Cellulomonas sp.]